MVVSVQYVDNKFIFSDEETAKKIWKFDGFLFQKLGIDKEFLSKLSLKNKHFNGNNGSFDIDYIIKNTTINQYFNKKQQAETVLGFGSSLRLDDFYYYSVTVDFNDGYYFKERVSNAERSMSKKDTANSGIATLDAANLAYEFENAREYCFYGIL